MPIDFSIIIPARNRADMIARAVASVYAQDYDPTRYEVIVVDNGSADETAREAARAGARVVSESEPNRCRARNLGAAVARGRWFVFTDSDCEAERDWLKEIARVEDQAPIIAGAIVSGPASNAVEAYIAERRWIDNEVFLANDPARRLPPFAATANLAIRRDVFMSVGGFDPELPTAGEDAEWRWRAAAAGHAIHYARAARVIHHHRATVKGMLRQAREYGLGGADLYARAAREPEKWVAFWGGSTTQPVPGGPWIEWRRYVWAAKALVKTPFALAFGRGHARWFPFYDFLSNLAHAKGRREGGRKHGIRIL